MTVADVRARIEAELAAVEEQVDPALPFDPALSQRVDALLAALELLDRAEAEAREVREPVFHVEDVLARLESEAL